MSTIRTRWTIRDLFFHCVVILTPPPRQVQRTGSVCVGSVNVLPTTSASFVTFAQIVGPSTAPFTLIALTVSTATR